MGHKRLVLSDPSTSYPLFLKSLAKSCQDTSGTSHPTVISMDKHTSTNTLKSLISNNKIVEVVDNYGEQYAELLLSKNAHLYQANYSVQVSSIAELLTEHYGSKAAWQKGTWVYFPWTQKLIHVLGQKNFEELRTIRNRDLITNDEQHKLLEFEVGCFGMSVGSASAQALGITGISRKMKLIDGAVISGSNLNRIQTGVASVGLPKSIVVGRQLYEMNPYAKIIYHDKVDSKNSSSIFDKPWPIKLAIDEIDDLEMKIQIRIEAKKRKIPVLMASDLGDTVILDIERYDLDPELPLFHNLIPGIEELLSKKIENRREWMKHAMKILDSKNMSLKLQKSLLKIGTTIVTHPQLGSTVMMTGGAIAFAVKNIALGNKLKSGRYQISLENMLLTDHKTRAYKKQHKKHTKIVERALSSM